FSDYSEIIAQMLEGVLKENVQSTPSYQKESESILSNFEERIQTLEKNLNSEELLGGLSDYLILLAIALGILSLFLAISKGDSYEDLLPRILESKRLRDLVQSNNSFNRNIQSNNSNTYEIKDLHNRIGDL